MSTVDYARLIGWVREQLDDDAAVAREASRHRDEPLVDTGAHWQWECNEHDEAIEPQPLTDEFLGCPQTGYGAVSLRSVETYPYRAIPGEGPSFALPSVDEVSPVVALHIARHDPASVLADAEAKRRMVDDCARQLEPVGDLDDPCRNMSAPLAKRMLRALASAYRGRDGYQAEWGEG